MNSGGFDAGLFAIIIFIFVVLVVLSIKFKALGKILGGILFIAGLAAIGYGMVRANSFESQAIRAFGGNDETMMSFFVIGGIGVVLGIIFFVAGISKSKATTESIQAPAPRITTIDNTVTANVVKVRCPKCQGLNDETSKFCAECGNQIILEEKQA